jgi:photosystem II stability/assembly factor-like uncharacterized protein
MPPVRLPRSGACVAVTLLAFAGVLSAAQPARSPLLPRKLAPRSSLMAGHRGRSLCFEENAGQTDPRVRFVARGRRCSLFVGPNQAVLALAGRKSTAVRMRLAGANPNPRVRGVAPLPGRVHYLTDPDPRKWRTDIRTYERVRCEQVYPGVDLEYHGRAGFLEHDFLVDAGCDPRRIRLAFDGVRSTSLDSAGDLVLSTESGELRQSKPVAYQEVDGHRIEVRARYRMAGAVPFSDASRPYIPHPAAVEVGFELAAYDRTRPVVIDPIIEFSTFLGGHEAGPVAGLQGAGGAAIFDIAEGVAIDPAGNIYVTGRMDSPDFPVTPGAFRRSPGGIFVTKLDPRGTTLLYSTYLGGFGSDAAGIAVDAAGSASVTGSVGYGGFPTTPNAFQRHRSSYDAFVTKLNPAGSGLLYSSFLGGSGGDAGRAIATDLSGLIYLTGSAASSDFPIRNALQPERRAGTMFQPFVAKFDPSKSGEQSLLYSTFIGGDGEGLAVAADASGSAYLGGYTMAFSKFTTTPGALVTGCRDDVAAAFIAKLAPNGAAYDYSACIGSVGATFITGIAVDNLGSAHVTGRTGDGFPTSPGAFQTSAPAFESQFVAKLDASGSALVYSTYLGPSAVFPGVLGRFGGIALDAAGNAWITGTTRSADFPVTPDAFQPLLANQNLFKTKNGGQRWFSASTGLRGSPVRSLVVAPSTPATVYAGTGAGVYRDYGATSGGVFKSTDGGKNWAEASLGLPRADVNALAVDPVTPSTLYAGLTAGPAGSLYKTTDSGQTWVLSATGLGLEKITSLAVDPARPAVIYAGGGAYAGSAVGLFRSEDAGATWRPTQQGLPADLTVFTIAIDPRETSTVYAAGGEGVFKSVNDGATWFESDTGIPPARGCGNCGINGLAIDPAAPSTIYASGVAVFKTVDGGATWRPSLDLKGWAIEVGPLAMDVRRPSLLYLGEEQRGLVRSTNGGAHWARAGNVSRPTVIAVDPRHSGMAYAGTANITEDAFVSKLSADGSTLLYSTYLGGSSSENSFSGGAIAAGPEGSAVVVGDTSSGDFPVVAPLQGELKGETDAFIVKFRENPAPRGGHQAFARGGAK